jgi:HNH endonuclease
MNEDIEPQCAGCHRRACHCRQRIRAPQLGIPCLLGNDVYESVRAYRLRRGWIGMPCAYCGIKMKNSGKYGVTRDHVEPRSNGNTFALGNKLFVCYKCNQSKKAFTLEQWHRRLHEGCDPRAKLVEEVIRERSVKYEPESKIQEAVTPSPYRDYGRYTRI